MSILDLVEFNRESILKLMTVTTEPAGEGKFLLTVEFKASKTMQATWAMAEGETFSFTAPVSINDAEMLRLAGLKEA